MCTLSNQRGFATEPKTSNWIQSNSANLHISLNTNLNLVLNLTILDLVSPITFRMKMYPSDTDVCLLAMNCNFQLTVIRPGPVHVLGAHLHMDHYNFEIF